MLSDIRPMILVIAATLAAACSGTLRNAPSGAGNAVQPQPALPAPAGANSRPKAPEAAAANGDVDTNLIKAGYSVMRRHGEVYYCRNEIITGQRIATRICLAAGQIQDEKQNVTKARDMLDQPSYQCLGASCKN